jgi:demethylmenaquinone methyltransferase/2-methoxy-6-polyprenyl-1,4-benzoquinol methylase
LEGLGKEWKRVQSQLERLIPVYERGNRILSFGKIEKLRFRAVSMLKGKGLLLDIGCGPGYMAKAALNTSWKGEVVLFDPLIQMLNVAKRIGEGHPVQGIAEALPFRDGCIDAWVAGFSLRDAMDRRKAFHELARVLKREGKGVMLDLTKPDNLIKRALIYIYWSLSPIVTLLRLGSIGLRYSGILLTYKKLSTTKRLRELFSSLYKEVMSETSFLGGVIIVRVSGPVPKGALRKAFSYPR